MTVPLALLGALFIGISDFLGGAASREASPLTVSAVLQFTGLLTLAPIAAVLGASALTAGDLGLGAVSGLVTSVAFLGFFTAMAHGRIGVVLPVSAAVAARNGGRPVSNSYRMTPRLYTSQPAPIASTSP